MNILERALNIVYKRSEEKTRQYGPFNESMARAARVASELCNKEISTEDMYKCLVALKMSRLAYNYKEDTFLDAIAYLASLNDYLNKSHE